MEDDILLPVLTPCVMMFCQLRLVPVEYSDEGDTDLRRRVKFFGLGKLNVSLKLRRGCVWLGAMFLHRHGAIVWYAFGVAWLNSRGVGL